MNCQDNFRIISLPQCCNKPGFLLEFQMKYVAPVETRLVNKFRNLYKYQINYYNCQRCNLSTEKCENPLSTSLLHSRDFVSKIVKRIKKRHSATDVFTQCSRWCYISVPISRKLLLECSCLAIC